MKLAEPKSIRSIEESRDEKERCRNVIRAEDRESNVVIVLEPIVKCNHGCGLGDHSPAQLFRCLRQQQQLIMSFEILHLAPEKCFIRETPMIDLQGGSNDGMIRKNQ